MHNLERVDKADIKSLLLNGTGLTANAADLNLAAGLSTVGAQVKRTVKVALGALDTGGGVLSWQNPEGADILINRLTVVTTTKSTAASAVSFGTTAVGATTSSANLLDTLDTGTATVITDNLQTPGANGKQLQKLAAGKWVTGSKASGACAGLVGSVYIEYFLL
jgi:hypothetical protein